MTTTKRNHTITDVEHEDEIVVAKILAEMILDERWDITDLGRDRLQECRDDVHRHHLVLWPFGKKGEPDDCVDPMHMRDDGTAVWRCRCGYRICRSCFEVHSRYYTISVVDQR